MLKDRVAGVNEVFAFSRKARTLNFDYLSIKHLG
jgi:hypothetical protein